MRGTVVRRDFRTGHVLALLVLGAALATLMWLANCSHPAYHLVPGPGATAASGAGPSVSAENNGVHMLVSTQAWAGNPPTLTDFVLPVWVDIQNHSGRSIWLRYGDFHIDGGAGHEVALRVIPPFNVKGTASIPERSLHPPYGWTGFSAAPYLGPSYFGLDPWMGAEFPMDWDYYSTYQTTWQEPLPTADMLSKALPEGALKDGGHVSGFLYFQRLKREIHNATFTASFQDAASNQAAALISVQYLVTR